VLGYVRERVFAHYFGNDSIPADAFRAALRIPNTIRSLLGEGTLSASFIPVYAALNERPDKAAARSLAGAILGLLLLASGVLALLGIALAPAITTLIAQGFDEPRRQLTITLVRILFPMTGLMVVSAWCLGILNTHRRFFLPYAAPALWNVAGIVAMLGAGTWFANHSLPLDVQLHRLSLALAWGTVAGSLLQIGVQLPACWRLLQGISRAALHFARGGGERAGGVAPAARWRRGRAALRAHRHAARLLQRARGRVGSRLRPADPGPADQSVRCLGHRGVAAGAVA